jgi:two-component system phosphate regulon sensor histidine kinase PhoR
MLWRLLLIYGLLVGASLALVGLTSVRWSSRFEQERLEGELLARAKLIAEALRRSPPSDLREQVDRLANLDGGDVRITILNEEGRVLADSAREAELLENHSLRPEILAARDRPHGIDLRHSRSVDRELLYVAIRTELPDSHVAFVRVSKGPGEVRGFAFDLSTFFLIGSAVALTATFIASVLLTRWMRRPIQEVANVAEEIAAGSYGKKVYPFEGGETGRLVSAFNNMSERLAAQMAGVEADREQLRAILGGMVEGVIALDPEQGVLFANRRAAQLLEFKFGDIVGRKLWEVVRHRMILDLVQRCLTHDDPQKEELSNFGRANRSMLVHAVRLARGHARGAIIVVHDTSDLRRLERLRQEFVANVSHELKTPLTVIKACVETLLDEDTLTATPHTRDFLQQIADQSERLHNLILDLLSLARIEAGSELFSYQLVNLADVAEACVQRHHLRAEARRQSLRTLPSPPELEAWVDEEATAEILDNLVDNALKYTQVEGSIRVRWWPEGEFACLEVKDDGIGIPEQDLPRIFERFYRVDKARSRELGGTGLGLSIVKHLVQAMGGNVAATSQLGQGSSFQVRLPRRPREDEIGNNGPGRQ